MKQVYFHVGAPKTGTTFLQQVMWHNRRRLADRGVCYPLDHPTAHFTATLDLLKRKWGGRWDPAWDGAWDTVADRIRRWPGDRAIFSAEIMGLAPPAKAQQAADDVQPAEVHVVFTARDFARQLPSDWQEQVKHRHTVTLDKFVDDLLRLGHEAPRPFGELFWGLHDPVYVLRRWADAIPPERIHLVTVPHATAGPNVLWQRFATVCGLDPDDYDLDVRRDNTAMGVVEAEFLRRFNTSTASRELAPEHGPIINNLVGQRILAGRSQKQPIRLPRRHFEPVRARSEEMITSLASSGYDIVGDLAELRPEPPPDEPEVLPGHISDSEIDAARDDLIAGLVQEVLMLRTKLRRLNSQIRPNSPGAKKAAGRKPAGGAPRQRPGDADAAPARAEPSQPTPR